MEWGAADVEASAPPRADEQIPIIGLGGSAGSINALREFFKAMPPDSGMAFAVVLHLSTEHESTLASLIQRTTTMPVAQVEGRSKVAADHVYVIPPGKSLVSTDGYLQLDELGLERGRRMTVDTFFRTLADSHGSRAAAIVLSGADGDGAIGIKRIKEHGGLTVAQDPEEAEYPGMPRTAIATGMIDWVLRIADMPARLLDYGTFEKRLKLPPEEGTQPAAPPPADADEIVLRDVLAFLRTRTGRDFSHYKRATLLRRIARRMQLNSVEDLRDYREVLRTHASEASALLQDLLISVTNFFRDQDAFASLQSHFRDIFAGRTQQDVVRVWVPACATGEEAYSLAILLDEYAGTLESPPAIQIFATDLHDGAIQSARRGSYPEAIAADVSDERLRRCFVKQPGGYQIRREIRELVMFATHDLLKDPPFSRIDLISCRNLLIYLDRSAQDRVFDIFHFSLASGGLLFLGLSESIDDGSVFAVSDKKNRIYVHASTQRPEIPRFPGPGSLALALRARPRQDAALPGPVLPAEAAVTPSAPVSGVYQAPSWARLHALLVEWLAPPSLVVNADYEIVHLSEKAGRYLHFAGGEPSRSLLNAVLPALRVDLRTALYRATQTKAPAEAPEVPVEIDGKRLVVDIRVMPAAALAEGFLLVTFDARSSGRVRDGVAETTPGEEQAHSQRLEVELQRLQAELRDTVEQHEASTEEQKAGNEELQAINEELRSATEELETSREELQSLNEELTTVNQELRASMDDLIHANSDLQNLMAATAIATIFLDRALRIMRYTPPAVELFNLIPTDVGRPLTDLTHRLDYVDLERDAGRVLESLVPVEREIGEHGGRWFLTRLLPYRTLDDRIAGVVLTFLDISDVRNTREALIATEERYRTLFNTVDEGIAVQELIVDDQGRADFRYLEVNPAFGFQFGRPDVIGRTLSEVFPGLEAAWLERFTRVVESGEPVRFEMGMAGIGRVFDVFAFKVSAPGTRRIVTLYTDATARTAARTELIRANDDLERSVAERTRELGATNLRMLTEVAGRIRLEEARAKVLLDFASAQEDERSRVARDLHDSLGQHLAALGMGLKSIETVEDCPPALRARIREMRGTTERLDEEIDRLAHALRPLALSDLGLEAALRQHVEAWSQESGIEADVQSSLGAERLSFIEETTVYRVVQEALTNVRKHAGATRVSLVAEQRARELRVIIEDNGNGFDPEQPGAMDSTRHLGLRGMRERAGLVGGDLQIESAPGKGTTIFLTIPTAPPGRRGG